MSPPLKCCRTCHFFKVPPNADGKRRIYRDRAYRCIAPLPRMPALPDSLTTAVGYIPLSQFRRCSVTASDGTSCPVWTEFVPDAVG